MDEEKKADAEAKANAEAEFQKSIEGLSNEEKAAKIKEHEDSSSKDTELDEALEAEKRRSSAKERFEEKEEKDKGKDDEDDKPLTKKQLAEFLEARDDKIRKETREEQAIDIANELTDNPKEASLILSVWKNRRLVGSLREQLAEAQAIALSKRTMAKNAELKRALAGKEGIETSGENAQRKPAPRDAQKLSATDKSVLTGFTFDNTKRAYKKTIAGGRKILFVSEDLKTRWTENAPSK